MEFKQLRYFVGIVDAGSLTRAAQHLHIAQPALSQQIVNLEAELGVKLLTRSVRGVAPTDAGQTFYRHSQFLLRSCSEATAAVRSASEVVSGTVSVGLPTSVGSVVAVPLIAATRKRFPAVHLQLTDSPSAFLVEMLLQGRLDMAILFTDESVKGLDCRPLVMESLLFATRGTGQPDAGPLRDISLSEVADHELLLPIRPNHLRLRVDDAFALIGRVPKVVAEVSSMSVLTHAVASGLADTITSWSVVSPEHASGAVVARRIVEPEITRTLSLCQSKVMSFKPATLAVHSLLAELLLKTNTGAGWRSAIGLQAP